jgi:hypothetical protein
VFPEGELRADTVSAADLRQYRSVVLPDCRFLTAHQASALLEYAAGGGILPALGRLGENLPADVRERLRSAVTWVESEDDLVGALAGGPQLVLDGPETDVAVGLHQLDDGVALHLIRYDHDDEQDAVPPLAELAVTLRLAEAPSRCTAHSPDGRLTASVEPAREGRVTLRLRDVPLYGIVELH